MEIKIFEKTGDFAENKDIARDMRVNIILPALKRGESVILNFKGVNSATQSFIHALISDVIRQEKPDVLNRIEFKSCTEAIKRIVEIVTDYMQQKD